MLDRMGPAIAQVAADNVESLGAIEQMLGALALESGPLPEAAASELRQAYAKAAANVTEEGKAAARFDQDQPGSGDPRRPTGAVLRCHRAAASQLGQSTSDVSFRR
ncbi:MAG: hypothetical protein R2748_33235 [Bryobacterales bacterium]